MKGHAYCKINLGLQVKSTLANGYHDLDMIMMPLNFYDIVTIEPNGLDHDTFYCNFGGRHFMSNNSVLDAIQLMRTTFARSIIDHFDVHLVKRIPSQAGLGGGSADGACAMKLLNRMYDLGLTLDELADLGVKIGADVPFCVINAPARVQGIGEKIRRFHNRLNTKVILVKPNAGVSTGECFKRCEPYGDAHINDELEYALRDGDYKKTCALLNNSLEPAAISLVDKIGRLKQALLDLGCDGALMSGSGSTVFGLVQDSAKAKAIAKAMQSHASFVRVCDFYQPMHR